MLRSLLFGMLFMTASIATASNSIPDKILKSEVAQRDYIQKIIRQTFPEDYPTMLAIAYCETRSRPFIHYEEDGTLRRHDLGVGSAAGSFQVLLKLHAPDIQRMGLDMKNINDYMKFVRWLYDRPPSRFSDWKESKECWQQRITSG